jgi:cephalosporin hydroxylase
VEVPDGEIPASIDLLFIDTSHLYDHTMAELKRYAPRVRPGGWIVFHDYVSFAGVSRAVGEFLASLPQRPRFYPYLNQNGLAMIKLDVPRP